MEHENEELLNKYPANGKIITEILALVEDLKKLAFNLKKSVDPRFIPTGHSVAQPFNLPNYMKRF